MLLAQALMNRIIGIRPTIRAPHHLYRELDLAAGLGTLDGRTSFGISIVPLKRKLGGDAEAGTVAAWKIEGRTRMLNAWEKSIRPSASRRPRGLSNTKFARSISLFWMRYVP